MEGSEGVLRDFELLIRLGSFTLVFSLLILAEWLLPRRHPTYPRLRRWLSNLAILGVSSVLVRLLMPLMAVDMGALAEERKWGLMHLLEISYLARLVLGVLLLDFVVYLQHIAFHYIPLLWRLHRVHHADTDFDTSLGIRFHPFEIILSMLLKVGVVAALGIPAAAVLIFEVLLNLSSLFTHSNLALPLSIDCLIRSLFVTPDMHRVHHSVIPVETNSNFGFNLSLWDRLCGTYRAQPKDGHERMKIGLEDFRDPSFLDLPRLLTIPFLRKRGV